MKAARAILSFVVVVSGAAQSHAQAVPSIVCEGSDRAACDYILAASREFAGMLTTADPAPLRRHLDPRALWISTSGDVRPGTRLIAAIERDARRATARLDQAHVRFFGDVAVVTWRESWTAPDAAVTSGRLAGVDTWVRRSGRWRVVSMAETRVAP